MQADTIDTIEARLSLLASYLTPSEMEEVRQRTLSHAADWQQLVADAAHAIANGIAPQEDAATALAIRWAVLFRNSHAGSDAALDAKIRFAYEREPGLSAHIGAQVRDFMRHALLHLHKPLPAGDTQAAGPKPSALSVAHLRAVHQLLDQPLILDDPLALKILGPDGEAALRANPQQYDNPVSAVMRTTIAVRSRLAEDCWHAAQEQGVNQYAILGAGLDTSAWRGSLPAPAAVYEVDLPGVQQWKRERLQAAGMSEPQGLHFIPVDFASENLHETMRAGGFSWEQPAFFSWLGVSMYLCEDEVMQTLSTVAQSAPGSSIVFDYLLDPELLSAMERSAMQMFGARLASQGEPWRCHFVPEQLEARLRQLGFRQVEHFAAEQLSERYLSGRSDGLRLGGTTRLLRAFT
ncbi:SAM-dependent methyltransferase [Massilia sp. BJB1822]|uniref:class I SAM-dependent methyltransferase n=1 Tax=Massilia sp. BJB1822 TaxID=2744470 RepID=UPI001594D029|nr:SAM-dependent methyltransferase [Massilia sp. BJB1822]NVD98261.1 SAM-dependent methyltransferase [Massilia sp. BJB1822]